MCGRIAVRLDADDLIDLYDPMQPFLRMGLTPRYNGAPSQIFAACRVDGDGSRAIAPLRWGLLPAWARDPAAASRPINARAETVHEKPSFRAAFKARRCLVPASGWFEWQKTGGRVKQPWYLAPADGSPLSLAAIWEQHGDGPDAAQTFAVITTDACETLTDVHHRQPAVIKPQDFNDWLDPDAEPARLLELARKPWAGPFEKRPVSTRVNIVANDDPSVLEPVRLLPAG